MTMNLRSSDKKQQSNKPVYDYKSTANVQYWEEYLDKKLTKKEIQQQ